MILTDSASSAVRRSANVRSERQSPHTATRSVVIRERYLGMPEVVAGHNRHEVALMDWLGVLAVGLGPLVVGGGLWMTVATIAKQVGETKRERIRQEAETQRLVIRGVLKVP